VYTWLKLFRSALHAVKRLAAYGESSWRSSCGFLTKFTLGESIHTCTEFTISEEETRGEGRRSRAAVFRAHGIA
jgi:hypothetical protein